MTAYVIRPPHQSQYQPGASAFTRVNGCTWTTGANGARATTSIRPTPDYVHSQVKRTEEENPNSAGWTIGDLDLAMQRLGVPFADRRRDGWAVVVNLHDAGYYLALQGDSDQFGPRTCSGDFNGDHCIGVHPEEDERGWWWIDDPICKTGRYESPVVLRHYAEKLHRNVLFGQFMTKVPKNTGLRLRYGGQKANPYPDRTRTDEPNVRIHRTPTTADSTVVGTIKVKGTLWAAYQVTRTGDEYAGSRRWYGNKQGDRWVHSSRLVHEGGPT
jgi:hypothetical protein